MASRKKCEPFLSENMIYINYNWRKEKKNEIFCKTVTSHSVLWEFLYAQNFVKYLLQNKGIPLLPIPNKKEPSYLDITLSYKDRKTGINPGEAVNKLYLCSLALYKQLFVYALWPGAQEGFIPWTCGDNSRNGTSPSPKNQSVWYVTSCNSQGFYWKATLAYICHWDSKHSILCFLKLYNYLGLSKKKEILPDLWPRISLK